LNRSMSKEQSQLQSRIHDHLIIDLRHGISRRNEIKRTRVEEQTRREKENKGETKRSERKGE